MDATVAYKQAALNAIAYLMKVCFNSTSVEEMFLMLDLCCIARIQCVTPHPLDASLT